MIQDLRKRIFIITGIIVLVVAAGVLLWLALRRTPKEVPATPSVSSQTPSTRATVAIQPPATPKINEDPDDSYVKQLAGIFIERIGSYSNQNENRHLDDALLLVTPRMKPYVSAQAEDFKKQYTGVTTRVIAVRIEKKSAVSATVHVDVQRVTIAEGKTTTTYDSGTVLLVRGTNDGEWKVDGVYWNT